MQSSVNLIPTQSALDITPFVISPAVKSTQRSVSAYANQSYAIVSHECSQTVSKLTTLTQNMFLVGSSIVCDTNAMASIFRKLDRHVIKGIEHLAEVPGKLEKLTQSLKHAVGLIDFVQVFTDIDYFYNRKFEKDRIFACLSKISVTVADFGGAILWLEELSFMHLSSIAHSMAEIRVFSFVPKTVESASKLLGLGSASVLSKIAVKIGEVRVFSFMTMTTMHFIATRALTLTYIFLAIDSVHRLINPGTEVQKTQASLDLALYLAELILDALMTIGVTNLVVMGATGVGAIALVIASFSYKLFHLEELKAEPVKLNILK